MLQGLIITILCAIGGRIRGGLGERWGWKFPLNKWWFAGMFTICCQWLFNFSPYVLATIFIAARITTQIAGHGEAVGCALGMSKPDPNRSDCGGIDSFCDNLAWNDKKIKIFKWTFRIKAYRLIDHPKAFGVLWLTIRGLYHSFLIGLALRNIQFMLIGCVMGVIYWACGRIVANTKLDDGKAGWNFSEYIYFGWYGLMLVLLKNFTD